MATIGLSGRGRNGVDKFAGLESNAGINEVNLTKFLRDDPNTQFVALQVEDLRNGQVLAEA